jgi:hypothetical protein
MTFLSAISDRHQFVLSDQAREELTVELMVTETSFRSDLLGDVLSVGSSYQ